MKYALILAMIIAATPAHAGRVVMSYSDSRGNTGNNTSNPAAGSWPQMLDAARTDFTVCNRPRNGWTTADAEANKATDLASCTSTGTVTDVLLLFGVNDFINLPGATSATTADRLLSIADWFELQGVRAWVLLEPPGPLAWGGFLDARKWTRDNVEQLQRQGGTLYRFINVRDEFTVTNWFVTTCSNDQLHPTGQACRQVIANAVSAVLP